MTRAALGMSRQTFARTGGPRLPMSLSSASSSGTAQPSTSTTPLHNPKTTTGPTFLSKVGLAQPTLKVSISVLCCPSAVYSRWLFLGQFLEIPPPRRLILSITHLKRLLYARTSCSYTQHLKINLHKIQFCKERESTTHSSQTT